MQPAQSITGLLLRWTSGERECWDELHPAIEGELRRIASRYMRRERPGHTLQTTALLNEAWARLIGDEAPAWQSRAHFFGIAARIMRRILVDHARAGGREKRGGGMRALPLDEALVFSPAKSAALLDLDEALERLAALDRRKARVIELRYFGGLSAAETAEALGVHQNTVVRDWSLAKAWLKRELETKGAAPGVEKR